MSTASRTTLHYIYDPFCGWCYAIAPLLTEAQRFENLDIVAHGGGMLANGNATRMSAEWREFVRPHESRIAALSGQEFGAAYRDHAQFDDGIVLDSAPPTAAMLAAQALSGDGIRMLKRLQTAYYVEGRPIADRGEILRQAAGLGLDAAAFEAAFDAALRDVDAHFAQSREWLRKSGANGYPTLLLERDGQIERLHLAQLMGRPEKLGQLLGERLEA
jgi:putative protein-disulfide isomerase